MIFLGNRGKSTNRSVINLNNQITIANNYNSANVPFNTPIFFKSKGPKPLITKPLIKQEEIYVDKDESTIYKNETFNWVHYVLLNPDLFYANIHTRELALNHFKNNGEKEDRKTILDLDEYNDYIYMYINYKTEIKGFFYDKIMEKKIKETYTDEEWKLFNKYPYLFHKYLLFIKNPKTPIQYKIAKQSPITKKYICAIHCYDLNVFDEYFSSYLNELATYFDIIVTYCLDNYDIVNKYNFTFIISQNIGMDIGGKFLSMKFLNDMRVDCDYIFFIHSKSDRNKRKSYIEPLTRNLIKINDIMNSDKNVGAFIPPWLYLGCMPLMYGLYDERQYNIDNFGINEIYINDLKDFLNLHNNINIFLEGNVFILNKKVADVLYSNIYVFNALNFVDSFDYNWVNNYYSLNDQNISSVYKKQKQLNLHPNNLSTKLGHNGLADGMIEHSMERLIFQSCQKCNMRVILFDRVNNPRIEKMNSLFIENLLNINNKQLILDIYKNYPKKSNNICVMACHTDSIFKINNIVNNMFYLLDKFDSFYLINSSEFENNDLLEQLLVSTYSNIVFFNKLSKKQIDNYRNENSDLINFTDEELIFHYFKFGVYEGRNETNYKIINLIYVENTRSVCYEKYLHYYNNYHINCDKIILTNDSFLITRPLDDLFDMFSNKEFDMVSLNSSNELRYHYSDFLRVYNSSGFIKIMEYIKTSILNKDKSFYELITNIEIDSINLFDKKSCLYESEPNFYGNIHFDDANCQHYLYNLNYPIVKLKKITSYYYYNRDFPEDFNEEVYKSMHPDLETLTDLTQHFLIFGMSEGRRYKREQGMNPPQYIIEYLNNYIENNRNICFYEKI
jgi:hypothetical protein